MAIKFSNNALTTLSAAAVAADTTISVTSGSTFVTPAIGDYQVATITNTAKTLFEVVHITGNSGTALTVLRGREGTTPLDWDNGSTFFAGSTAGTSYAKRNVLNIKNFFSTDGTTANAQYLNFSIGNGSGTDGADFRDIYEYVDFLNNTDLHTYEGSYFGYFKNAGIVTLDRDIYLTNGSNFGNIFIQGAGIDGTPVNGPWSGTIDLNVTDLISMTGSTVVVRVDNVSGLYVGGLLAIYEAAGLQTNKQLMGAWPITAINSSNRDVTITLDSDMSGLSWTPSGGLLMPAKFNRTTIVGNGYNFVINGTVGCSHMDGGIYSISFKECQIFMGVPQAKVTLYDNLHIWGAAFSMYGGYAEMWGDVFLTCSRLNVKSHSSFNSNGRNLRVSGLNSGFYVTHGKATVKIIASGIDLQYHDHADVVLVSPDVGTTTYTPPTVAGSTITIVTTLG